MDEIWNYIMIQSMDRPEFSHARKAVQAGQITREHAALVLLQYLVGQNAQLLKMVTEHMEFSVPAFPVPTAQDKHEE